jgi:sugar lactone lactonase YvrE
VDLTTKEKTELIDGLDHPEDITIDSRGNIYVGGVTTGVVRIAATGEPLPPVGTNVCGAEGAVTSPRGDHVIVNTRQSPCDHSGLWLISAGEAPTAVQITPPFSGWGEGTAFLTAGPFAGQLIAVARPEGRIVRIDPSDFGNLTKAPVTFVSGLSTPFGIAINSAGEIYVAEGGRDLISVFNPDGTFKHQFSMLGGPRFIDFDVQDNLYVALENAGKVIRVSPDGTMTDFITIPRPVGIAILR